nr:putative reverse transcriptase domain-containing protein [Tanacetum cinerariifolium]
MGKVGTVAYHLELPKKLSRVHSTFHFSNLKKCLSDETLVIPLDEIQVNDKLHCIEELIEIINDERTLFKIEEVGVVPFSGEEGGEGGIP